MWQKLYAYIFFTPRVTQSPVPRTDPAQLTLHGLLWSWNQVPNLVPAARTAAEPFGQLMSQMMSVVMQDLSQAEALQAVGLFERVGLVGPDEAREVRARARRARPPGEAGPDDDDVLGVVPLVGLTIRGARSLYTLTRWLWARIAARVGKKRAARLVRDTATKAADVAAPLGETAPLVIAKARPSIYNVLSVLGWTAAGTLAASGGAAVIGAAKGAERATARFAPSLLLLGLGAFILSERTS